MTTHRARPVTSAVWITVVATSLGVLAPFLVGALSVLMQDDFDIGPRDIGVAVGAFFAVAGLAARILSRTVERIGVARSMAVATAIGTASLLAVAVADRWLIVVLGLVLGGTGSATIHPATAQLLAANVETHNLGVAFGFKQSGAPASTLVAGLAIPMLALWIGWRATFVAAAGVVAVVGLMVVRVVARLGDIKRQRVDAGAPTALPSHVRLLALGAGLGNAAGNAFAALLVDGGVRFSGVTESTAGYVLAAMSVAAVAMRVVLGWAADTGRYETSRLLVWMPAIGVAGAALLAIPTPAAFVVGAVLAFPIGWGWSGLLHYQVVAPHRDAAARLTGGLMTGFSLGAAAGPLALGFVADATSYAVTWLLAGGLFVLAATAMHVGGAEFTATDR